jgi:hypothetical protein
MALSTVVFSPKASSSPDRVLSLNLRQWIRVRQLRIGGPLVLCLALGALCWQEEHARPTSILQASAQSHQMSADQTAYGATHCPFQSVQLLGNGNNFCTLTGSQYDSRGDVHANPIVDFHARCLTGIRVPSASRLLCNSVQSLVLGSTQLMTVAFVVPHFLKNAPTSTTTRLRSLLCLVYAVSRSSATYVPLLKLTVFRSFGLALSTDELRLRIPLGFGDRLCFIVLFRS